MDKRAYYQLVLDGLEIKERTSGLTPAEQRAKAEIVTRLALPTE